VHAIPAAAVESRKVDAGKRDLQSNLETLKIEKIGVSCFVPLHQRRQMVGDLVSLLALMRVPLQRPPALEECIS
jgi:hypothetical protein